jgi:hypothetical protein
MKNILVVFSKTVDRRLPVNALLYHVNEPFTYTNKRCLFKNIISFGNKSS